MMFQRKLSKPFKIAILIGLTLFFSLLFTKCFAATPSNGIVSPSSGSGKANIQQIFTTTYSDPSGWKHIQYGYFIINTTTAGANCFYASYNQNANKLYLKDDSGTTWLGGFTPGSSNTIENSYAKLSCAQTTVSGSANTLIVKWSITLKSCFVGTKNLYLYVRDDTNLYQAVTQKGTWTIPNHAPAVGTVTPNQGSSKPNEAITLTTTYSDADTWKNIKYVYFRLSTSPTAWTNCFYGYYDQDNNKFYLRNDANTAWLGGYASGLANIIENSYAKLDCSKTTVTGNANTLTINWKIIPKDTFSGLKNSYLYVKDDLNACQGWLQKGTWNINQILSILVNPKLWDIGLTEVNKIITMIPVNKITVTNNGTGPETFDLKLIDPLGWIASTSVGNEKYVLSGVFCGIDNVVQEGGFNLDNVNEDIIMPQSKKATSTVFAFSQYTDNGVSVLSGSSRSLYLQFKSPTVTEKKGEQEISVIVSCQVP